MKALVFVEIDIDYCSLVYGTAPCMATTEGETPTGAAKCFNSIGTCQDRENFASSTVTLRFAQGTAYLAESGIDAIAAIEDVSVTPGTISLGEDLGTRSSLRVTMSDFPWSDTGPGFDKYLADRAYDPFRQGTFWGKFRARFPSLRGRPIRVIRGFLGQTLEEMETRHFVIESTDGPTSRATFSIVAKDALKLASGDRAQAPRLSRGFLVGSLAVDGTTATLSPAGIGDLEYPSSGYVAIGGKEICAFTRSGDVLTLTRAQLGTEASQHGSDDRVQIVLRYVGEDPADIISDLLQTYANVPAGYIPLATWQDETANYLKRVYTATIADPVAVGTLLSELIEQAALALWWSDIDQQIRLQVLRGIPTTAARFTMENVLKGSFDSKEQPDRRISQVWTYFGQRNPLERVEDPDNYRSTAITVDLAAETDYGSPAIKKIFARWIPAFGRTVALRLNDIQLGRFVTPPRHFSWEVLRSESDIVSLGGGYRLEWRTIQDATGAPTDAPVQVTRIGVSVDKLRVEAEEMLFQQLDPEDLTNRTITVDSNSLNLNLRSIHDTLYPAPTDADVLAGVTLTCIIESGVIVGSALTANPAFDVGSWPDDFPITLVVNGRIQGRGGDGAYDPAGSDGLPGGTALYTRFPVDLEVGSGEIFGGGGGGAGNVNVIDPAVDFVNGGGGAGSLPGNGGPQPGTNPVIVSKSTAASNGTTEAGGLGSQPASGPKGGTGGGPGLAGQSLGGSAGGAAGTAIDGDSYITVTVGPGDIRGPQIN
ncbi:hypothetical protein ABUE31_21640 [Mesorhizobium sp. ZMM04-5]|uniref:Receptor-recognising protein Gp38 domain-containing protein n=1 Tax=Mesorhizobium marinum TaxID=3228790 RepID=A0ABV3R6J4_9HYPH